MFELGSKIDNLRELWKKMEFSYGDSYQLNLRRNETGSNYDTGINSIMLDFNFDFIQKAVPVLSLLWKID